MAQILSLEKSIPAMRGDPGSILGSGRSSGERNRNPLQYSCLENSMDREAWWATVHGVSKSKTPLQLTLHGFVNIFDLFNVKEESEKVGLKLDIQKTKTMGSGPITSWR